MITTAAQNIKNIKKHGVKGVMINCISVKLGMNHVRFRFS